MKKVKNALKLCGLAFKTAWELQKGRVFLWTIYFILPSMISIAGSWMYSRMIDGITDINEVGIGSPLIWFGIMTSVSILAGLMYRYVDMRLFLFIRKIDKKMMDFSMTRRMNITQITFDSASRFDKVKVALQNNKLSLWGIISSMQSVISRLVTDITVTVLVLPFSPFLCLITLGFALVMFLLDIFHKNTGIKHSLASAKPGFLTGHYTGYLGGGGAAKELMIYGEGEKFIDKWSDAYKKLQKIHNRFNFKKLLNRIVLVSLNAVFTGLVSYICISNIYGGSYTLGDYTFYTSNLATLLSALTGVSHQIVGILKTSEQYEIFDSFAKATSDGERKGTQPLPEYISSIRFEHVWFSYEDTPVLRDISFEWKAGETLAVIGRNGSGKTTLIKLICGLYEPDSGEIYINDINVKQFAQNEIYKNFGVLYQDFCHYRFTVRDNIATQKLSENRNEEKLWDAFRKSGMTEFQSKLKKGLDTEISKKYDKDGFEPSGGQWQKLAIAKNYFGDRPYQIYDEPASALDPLAEKNLNMEILSYTNNAVIEISHRLSIGKLADCVIFLQDGEIIEMGAHDELMKKGGEYAKMYALQASLYGKEV